MVTMSLQVVMDRDPILTWYVIKFMQTGHLRLPPHVDSRAMAAELDFHCLKPPAEPPFACLDLGRSEDTLSGTSS